MKVRLNNNKEYCFGFSYKKHPKTNKCTEVICYIKECFKDKPSEVIAEGKAKVSKYDNHCKEIGRKLTLTRALDKKFKVGDEEVNLFTKNDRAQFWGAYHSRLPYKFESWINHWMEVNNVKAMDETVYQKMKTAFEAGARS